MAESFVLVAVGVGIAGLGWLGCWLLWSLVWRDGTCGVGLFWKWGAVRAQRFVEWAFFGIVLVWSSV